MIPSFYIENFRLFKRLEIEELRRVNLFVGKNNAGKSAFLEAIYLYGNSASPRVLLELIEGRQEYWESRDLESPRGLAQSPLRHLFAGHEIPGLLGEGFRLGLSEVDEGVLEVKTAAFYFEEFEDRRIRKRIDPSRVADYINDPMEIQLVMESEERARPLLLGDGSVRKLRRNQLASDHGIQGSLFPVDDAPRRTILVPTRGISDAVVATYWDMVNLTVLENEVVRGLQVIEPSLIEIGFVENVGDKLNSSGGSFRQSYNYGRIPMAKIQGISDPIPLKSLGDGITQVFHMVLAMVNAKGGTVLLDEFENGLHWSVQEDVWRIVFDLAERLNIQVFATTHSRDCVEGFRGAWSESESSGAFFRLSRCGDEVEIKPYDLETLSDSIETSVEVR